MWYTTLSSYGNLAIDYRGQIPPEIQADIEQPLRFQGQYHDQETGLHYNRHRYYDPNTASFITEDPIKLAGGINNYQYVPNPVQWIDPLGLSCKESWGTTYTNTLGEMAEQAAAEQNELHGKTSGWGNVMQGIYKPIEGLGRGIGNTVGLLEAMGPNGISPQVKGYWADQWQGVKDIGSLAYSAATGDPKAWAQLTPAIVGGVVARKLPVSKVNKISNPLSQSKIDQIIATPKGERPDPSTYLSKGYMDNHKEMFKNGAARIQPSAPTGKIGRTETWVMPSDVAQDAIKKSNGNPRELENLLGLDDGYLGDNPVLVKIPETTGYKIPSGNEFAAYDDFWRPGGLTHPGGLPEATIDPVQPGSYTVETIF